MPSWDQLEVLLAVIDGGSLSSAARALGVSQPTVRRQIEALEASLGALLFTRTTTGLQPTEAALAAREHAADMARSAGALVRSTSGSNGKVSGTVRLTCSEIIGAEVLPDVIARLLKAHPDLDIEIHVSNRDDDVLRREADIAVRMHRPAQVGLMAKRARQIELGLFASRAYLVRKSAPMSPDELRDHVLIGQDHNSTIREALSNLLPEPSDLRFSVRSDNDLCQLQMIAAGVGIGVCQLPVAERRDLVRVLHGMAMKLDVWLTMHENLKSVARYRIVFDYLADNL